MVFNIVIIKNGNYDSINFSYTSFCADINLITYNSSDIWSCPLYQIKSMAIIMYGPNEYKKKCKMLLNYIYQTLIEPECPIKYSE